jgi:Xaa-Pro dipeptidase
MDERTRDPIKITAEDINPRYNWGRHLPVLGTMGVDFEERVDYRRMHRYRLARAQAALEASDCGALLLFDDNNVRYVTSTKIGEWSRDKLSRWTLLMRGQEPILWDFGSAAVHHKLYSPWLKPENCRAGLVGLRGTVDPAFGLMKRHAEEMASLLKAAGVAKMPIGVDFIEPPMIFELEKCGLKIKDGQQIMLSAREVKCADEIALLNRAAAMVDGAYDVVHEMLRPGIRENDIVAEVNKFLYTHGSDDVEAVNAISGERCSPHPHNFTDRMIRPGDQASSTSCSRSWATVPVTTAPSTSAARRPRNTTPTAKRANGWTRRSSASSRAPRPRISARSSPRPTSSASPTRWRLSACSSRTASA